MKKIAAFILFSGAFLTLLALGTWQLQRLEWKENIITNLETIYAQDPEQNILSFDDLKITDLSTPILYGSVEGQFNYSKELLLGPRADDGNVGFSVITPLLIKDGGTILVNRGFLSAERKEEIATTQINGFVKVSGLIRAPDWNSFTPNNNPEHNVWSKLDIDQIAQAKNIEPVAPVILYAEKSSLASDLLKLQQEKWMPRNKHLQYAIFWYAMAIVLCGVFGLVLICKRKSSNSAS